MIATPEAVEVACRTLFPRYDEFQCGLKETMRQDTERALNAALALLSEPAPKSDWVKELSLERAMEHTEQLRLVLGVPLAEDTDQTARRGSVEYHLYAVGDALKATFQELCKIEVNLDVRDIPVRPLFSRADGMRDAAARMLAVSPFSPFTHDAEVWIEVSDAIAAYDQFIADLGVGEDAAKGGGDDASLDERA